MPDAFPISGLDRADGTLTDSLMNVIGTATPAASRQIRTADGNNIVYYEELPTSPEVERAEQGTIRHTFSVDYASTGLLLCQTVGRGMFLTDSNGNITRVLSSKLTHDKGDRGLFEVVAESISFDTPIDEFDCDDVEENVALEWHPKFKTLREYNLTSAGNRIAALPVLTGYDIVRLARTAGQSPNISTRNDNLAVFDSTTIPDADVLLLAVRLVDKLRRGETEFYFSGLRVTWSQYFYLPPFIDTGGYIQNPVTQGSLPAYFWSDTADIGGANTLEDLTLATNPDLFGDGFSWLRKSDKRGFQRIWHKITRTWIGAPLGHWDEFIYPQAV